MLNKHLYKVVEFTNENGMVIGRIWKDASNNFMCAEIAEDYTTNIADLADVQDFLDEVKTIVNPMVDK